MEKKSKTTRKTKAKAKTKKPSLKNIKQAHGKQENGKFEPRTLDQVWGDTGLGKYNTFDADVYRDKLDNMAKTDLQAHATKIGLVPIDNRSTLTQRLVREFRTHVNSFKPHELSGSKTTDPTNIPEKVKKILEEGR